MRFYIINGRVTIKNLGDKSHQGYFMGYSDTTGVIIYWKPDHPFLSTENFMFGLMNIIIVYLYKTSTIQVIYYFKKTLKVLLII